MFLFTTVVVSVKFKKVSYRTKEKNKVKPVLVLSNMSSTDITLQIISEDVMATGMLLNISVINIDTKF